jgi:ribosomal protein L32
MAEPSRMPRYSVSNDGIGPYAIFYCDRCSREFRSQPDVGKTITSNIGKQALGGLLRNVPLVGGALASNVTNQDPRYAQSLTPEQLENAWKQVKDRFRECPTCHEIVCISDFDETTGFCKDDSPRKNEIAEAQGEQAGRALKGLAAAFGLDKSISEAGKAVSQAGRAAAQAAQNMARCPTDGTLAAPGTKFCPECGTEMIQPQVITCPACGQPTHGAKFCPNCGTKIEQPAAAPAKCPNCGAETKGAKFCPECGTKLS